MKYIITYFVWLIVFCAILSLGGAVVDIYNPEPHRLQSYFASYTTFLSIPVWFQNILILLLVNGVAVVATPEIRVILAKKAEFRTAIPRLIGVNLVTIVLILVAFVVLRALSSR